MGLLSWLGLRNAATLSRPQTASRGVTSPWSGPSTMAKIVVDDIFGTSQTITRQQAMAVPAIARARHLICATLARQPLRTYRDGEFRTDAAGVVVLDPTGRPAPVPMGDQPAWLYRTNTGEPPRLRMLWTLDDIFFYGWALWAVERGAEDQILDARRVRPDQWSFDSNGLVTIEGRPDHPDASEVILIPGMSEGLLNEGFMTVRGALDLEQQWAGRIRNPIPLVEIRYTGDEDLTKDERIEIRDAFIDARNDTNGVVMVTPRGFEVHDHGASVVELFVEGRNAVALDVARYANLPAGTIDASNVNATSVNYANVATKRNELHDYTFRGWALPIEERLSQDDVVARGQTVAFDLSALTVQPDTGTGPTLED